MSLPDEFFAPWEATVGSFDEISDVLTSLFEKWIAQGRLFAWRGVVNASWPLHSSLYRRLLWSTTGVTAPNETTLTAEEEGLLARVHQWGLHHGAMGRLSVLAQLATLQHFGAPTRLLDVSMNAYVGLWFAVEPCVRNGTAIYDDCDGRLFAIDISDRLINENSERRRWEDDHRRPWKELDQSDWCRTAWAWRPPAFQARIASQSGAFLFGGVPRTGVGIRWPKESKPGGGSWQIDQVRRCISLPLRLHKAEPEAGGVSAKGQPAYTFRIRATAKRDIRERLEKLFAYSHSSLYPDYQGFAQFATPHLLTTAPALR